MLGTKEKCPHCGYEGDPKFIKPYCIEGYDPLMVTVVCPKCGRKWELAPAINYTEEANEGNQNTNPTT